MRRVGAGIAVAALLAACGGAPGAGGGNLPFDEAIEGRLAPPGSALESEFLAESQLTADTVERPDLPPPCAADALETWTAQVTVGETSADAVIRIRNAGERWCELSIRSSPSLDPTIEPDVWLEPGDWADLVVGQAPAADGDCAGPRIVTMVELGLNDRQVAVPTAMLAECSWWYTALYPNERPEVACRAADLQAVWTEGFVLVRNAGATSCIIDESGLPSPGDGLAIRGLADGDVAAWSADRVPCGPTGARSVDVGGVTVPVDGIDVCIDLIGGPARPFFGVDERPLQDVAVDDPASVLGALDPFSAS